MFVAAKAAAEIAACAVAAASPVIPVSIRSAVAAAETEEILLASLAGMMILLSLPSSLQSLYYLTSPESWPKPSGAAVYYSGRRPSAVTQEAVVAGVKPPRVAATEATPQLQNGRRSVLGGYLSDHLRPVSRETEKEGEQKKTLSMSLFMLIEVLLN